jgi:hypothetical protein
VISQIANASTPRTDRSHRPRAEAIAMNVTHRTSETLRTIGTQL